MKKKLLHFVGIKGVGMTPLSIIAKEAGFKVSGCDIDEEFITDTPLKKAGIKVSSSFSEDHIGKNYTVITTGAHGGFDNPEVKFAKEKGLVVMTKGEAVAAFTDGFLGRKLKGISIAGSHGKTTTTAMVATVLKENGFDPSYLIGTSLIESLGLPGHYGKGDYFVLEADEYANEPKYDKTPQLLLQKPEIAVITNVELDHPDIFEDLSKLENVFSEFLDGVSEKGFSILCFDDPTLRKLSKSINRKVRTYGFAEGSDFRIVKSHISYNKTFFWVESDGALLGEFSIDIPGEHNALNALAAIIMGLENGISVSDIRKSLSGYKGSKRRYEFKGKTERGALLYDDYAHHPTEIKKTLQAFRQQFPREKIVCIFQPHTFSRTKKLFDDFLSSFNYADKVILLPIYSSLRDEKDDSVSSELLSEKMKSFHKDVSFLSRASDVVEYIVKNQNNEETIVLTMGAGDVYKVSDNLLGK